MINTQKNVTDWISAMRGPIVVLGAGGFIGANLFRRVLASRTDVYGVVKEFPLWRLEGVHSRHFLKVDITNRSEMKSLIDSIRPATLFYCASFGAYSFENDADLIYRTNFLAFEQLIELVKDQPLAALIHAGSSSEYGFNCAGPSEAGQLSPNSNYAVSKAAVSNFISYAGKSLHLPVANLRLYSVYGPYEDSSRLVPNVVKFGLMKEYPQFVNPDVSRDFVYIDDVCDAFLMAASKLTPDLYGESFNIGTGHLTTIRQVAEIAQDVFGIDKAPIFGGMQNRAWDLTDWYANPAKAKEQLGWTGKTQFKDGLRLTARWFESLGNFDAVRMTKTSRARVSRSITAIVACYMDEQAIPIMYERLVETFRKIKVEYEIIFVNDASPDNCEGAILELTAKDKNVVGITHSRNFGSQMAFRSGMEIATKDSCVLLDGDLQDPPELIEAFYKKLIDGYDVVYGRRSKRDMPRFLELGYKAFYRLLNAFSYINIPHDAGDFSLIDKRVISWILKCPERDLFMRGLRAYVGFKQVGVDYVRPERKFGKSTNSLLKNIAWAKRGIFSFSDVPMTMLTTGGIALLGLSVLVGMTLIALRLYAPEWVPPGITTTILAILFFGSVNIFAVGLVGEYVAKIMHEVKGRPRLIRSAIIRQGEIRQLLPKSE